MQSADILCMYPQFIDFRHWKLAMRNRAVVQLMAGVALPASLQKTLGTGKDGLKLFQHQQKWEEPTRPKILFSNYLIGL